MHDWLHTVQAKKLHSRLCRTVLRANSRLNQTNQFFDRSNTYEKSNQEPQPQVTKSIEDFFVL